MPDDPQSRSPGPSELVNRLRQQLILAQVRIMELEDVRDTLAPKLEETGQLLSQAQSLADRQSEAAAHLEQVRADLQAQYDHLRHVQHVTNEALNESRARISAVEAELASAQASAAQLAANLSEIQAKLEAALAQLADAHRQLADLQSRLDATAAESSARAGRIQQLDLELRQLKASRSWRWTAWLRWLERTLRGNRR